MDPIVEKLTTARVGLLLKAPFFGNMATRMRLIESDDWCPTAATNGRDFMYNTEFVKKLSVKKLEFLFAHEICHAIFDHFGRCGSSDRMLANIAQDYAVNQILVDERIGEKITEVKICYDPKYRGMAWEEIYDELYEKAEKIPMSQLLAQLGDLLDEHIKEEEGVGSEVTTRPKTARASPALPKKKPKPCVKRSKKQ
jgi:predicted metal-dependent peptidase